MLQQVLRARQPLESVSAEACSRTDLHPVIFRILASRGIDPGTGLELTLKNLLPPDRFKDIDRAAARVAAAIRAQESIRIVGDYDADGATATALAVLGLRSMGGENIDYTVPNRFSDGYGLTRKLAMQIAAAPPDLVITVDNGISSVQGVELLQGRGVDVIVTDHHLAGEVLPPAHAIVNPNQPGCGFEDKSIAGVGVMFYLLLVVNQVLREQGYYDQQRPQPDLLAFLDLVALGTVADVVALGQNNRILVAQGVARMRAGRLRPGIAAILRQANRDPRGLVAQDLGFVVGPRLNAAGRLEDISTGIECLLTADIRTADRLAATLDRINQERREIEHSMHAQALKAVESLALDRHEFSGTGMVLYDESWHEGVVGLVASRIRERTGLPALVFAPGEAADQLKGSARSIPEVHIRDVLANINSLNPGLIDRFGGHAMAAGLSIQVSRLPEFRQAFQQEVSRALAESPPDQTLLTDGSLEAHDLNQAFAEQIKSLLPWGQACPEPLFEGRFRVLSSRFVGDVHLKLALQPDQGGATIDAICFRYLDSGDSTQKRRGLALDRVRLAYSLDVNHFRGRKSLQLIVRYIEEI